MQELRAVESEPWPLTQMYAAAKRSSQAAVPPVSNVDPPEIVSLDRKFRIQKDRLIAWGFDWAEDHEGSPKGSIDQSIQRAGLTELVESIMKNVQDAVDDVERMRAPPKPNTGFPIEKPGNSREDPNSWTVEEIRRYSEQVDNLTTSIDTLCDLSRIRKGTTNASETSSAESFIIRRKPVYSPPPTLEPLRESLETSGILSPPSFKELSESQQELSLSAIEVDPASLILPEEVPPPYNDLGAPRPARVSGHLRRGTKAPPLPVLIDYATYDVSYRDENVAPPLTRLEQLSRLLRILGARQFAVDGPPVAAALPKLIAYFRDPQQARYGLVYELPSFAKTSEYVNLHNLLNLNSKGVADPHSPFETSPPVEQRFRLALELVTGISTLHESGFTHRNISSQCVALFKIPKPTNSRNMRPKYDIRKPLISAFDVFSEYNIISPPEYLQQNIYRHPSDPRLGSTAGDGYLSQYDLYSLGLVLLEVGLWHPLSDIYKEKYTLKEFRIRVEKVWLRKLAGRVGTTYMKAVQECINAGRIPKDADSSRLRLAVDKVITCLRKCCLIDGDEDDDEDVDDMTDAGSRQLATRSESTLFNELAEDAASSVQEEVKEKTTTRLTAYVDIEVPEDARRVYREVLEERLIKLLSKFLHTRESIAARLVCAGQTRETARPTILVECKSTKSARAIIQRRLEYDHDMFDVQVIRGKILRSTSGKARRSRMRRACGSTTGPDALNPHHHQRPLCGSSIGAWLNYEHQPPVTFGGMVLVDGRPFGMSVHHLLEEPESDDESEDEEEESTRSMGRSDTVAASTPNIERNFDIFIEDDDEDEDEIPDLLVSGQDDYDAFTDDDDGDTPGFGPGEADDILITQPALDDVGENFFPNEDDRDDDHLDSHTFGNVYASSGLRRTAHQGINHEIDWCLMDVRDTRLQLHNLVAGGKRYCNTPSSTPIGEPGHRPPLLDPVCRRNFPAEEDLFPSNIASSNELSGRAVHCAGRTCGLGGGQILDDMSWIRFPGRRSPSRVWPVRGEFGCAGDSGAWVFDNETGDVCGHILAWSSRFRLAYISPMDATLEDIRQTLGAERICLPGDLNMHGSGEPTFSLSPSEGGANMDQIDSISDLSKLDLQSASRTSMKAPAVAPTAGKVRARSEAAVIAEPTPVRSRLMANHMLHSGNPGHLEREWLKRRSTLGTMVCA